MLSPPLRLIEVATTKRDRDDAPDWDLGYPSTVELGDGSLFTVYYQRDAPDEHCSLLWSRWQLPG